MPGRLPATRPTPSQGISLTAHSYSQPPSGEVVPHVPLTHVMLAREETPRVLGWAMFRYALVSRHFLTPVGFLLVAALVAVLVLREPLAGGLAAVLLVLAPVMLYLRCLRRARAVAPPGFTLGLGVGATHLAVRHAVATRVTPYAKWATVERRGRTVVLRTRRGGVLPLPTELVTPALEQLESLVEATAGMMHPVDEIPGAAPEVRPVAAQRLPYAFECSRATQRQLTRAVMVRRLLTPRILAVVVVDLLILLSPLALGGSWLWAGLPASVTLLALTLGAWGVHGRLGRTAGAGAVIRAGVGAEAMVLEDPSGRVTIPFRGVERIHVMRHAVLVRSQLRSTVLLPRAVLPDAEIRRAQGTVAWLRSRR